MNTELLAKALEQERHMLCHFTALRHLLEDVDPITREEFAKLYPRTWNAVVTEKPYSFDLPEDFEH